MQKLNTFIITCPKCQTQVTLKTNSSKHNEKSINNIKLTDIGGKCTLCDNSLGEIIAEVRSLVNQYNEYCDKLQLLSNIKFIF